MDVRRLLTQQVTVATYTSTNGYGEPGFGAQRTLAARVEAEDAVQDDGDRGKSAMVTATIVTAEPIGLEDRVWLPGTNTADATQARRIISVDDAVPLYGSTPDYYVTKV